MITWEKIAEKTAGAAIGWSVSKVLSLLLTILSEETSAINSKLDKLLESPFKQGVINLRDASLAQSQKLKRELLIKARDKFLESKETSEGEIKCVESLIYGSYCYYLLGENQLSEVWLMDGYIETKNIYTEKVDKFSLSQENLKDPLFWVTVLTLSSSPAFLTWGTFALAGSLVVSAPILPALVPLGAGVGLIGTGIGSGKLSKYLQILEGYKKIQEVKKIRDSGIFSLLKNQNIPNEIKHISETKID